MEACRKLLDEFINNPDTEPFQEAVDWKGMGLFDYPKIVKTPMDLGTIQDNFDNYDSPDDFVRDMRLIWTNCMLYNEDGSDFHTLAKSLLKLLNKRLKALNIVNDENAPEPTVDEKLSFSQNIYKVSSQDLGQVVLTLERKCPAALEKKSTDELEINVDAIDGSTFQKLLELLSAAVPDASSSSVVGNKKKKQRVA